jgi:folate-binding protein YgfZ
VLEKNLVIDHGALNVYRVTGGDASEWLQRMLTADVNAVRDQCGAHALMLDRLGKIQADLALLATERGYDLIVLGGDAELMGRHMKRLIVMEDVEVSLVSAHLASFYGDAALARRRIESSAEHLVYFEVADLFPEGAMLGFDIPSEPFRTLLDSTGLTVVGAEAWDEVRIARGIPVFGRDFTSADNPGQAGLLTTAVSMTKGCYLGQEVVCKLVMRGALRERICRLRFDDTPSVGSDILCEELGFESGGDARVGTVTSVGTRSETGVWALGRVRSSAIDARASVRAEQVYGRIDPVTSSEGC